MKRPFSIPNQPIHSRRFLDQSFIYFIVPCLVFLFAITSRSFWIDEAYTASIAAERTLPDWWQQVFGQKTSDLQMPLYTIWIWACEKLVGSSELALRAVNMFWFIPALLALAYAMKGKRTLRLAAFLIAAFSPFAWYYLNEARSYTMQFSTSLFLYAVIYHWSQNPESSAKAERWWVWGFASALILLCGSSLLSMIFAGTPILMILVLLPKKRLAQLGRNYWHVWAGMFIVLLLLGLYYLWTMRIGARATAIATTDWKNPFFICYELLGFTGLGPGRLQIRGGGFTVFKPYAVILTAYAGVVAILLFLAALDLRQQIRSWKLWGCVLSVVLPVGFVLIASSVMTFRVLGRHFAAVAPVGFLLLAFGMVSAWRRGKIGRGLVVLFLGFYLTSALSVRFANRHRKDDYRTAAKLANAALEKSQNVWWAADRMSAWYYHVPLVTNGIPQAGSALLLGNPLPETIQNARPADLIVFSRSDVYDSEGTLAEFIRQENFKEVTNLVAFTIWERTQK